MAIVRQHHKDTNTTYVLTSEAYWDPVKKQSRSRRKIIGKIDPETGKVIPTGSKKRLAGGTGKNGENTLLTKKIRELEVQNELLQSRVNSLENENKKLHAKDSEILKLRSDVKKLRNIVKNARTSAQDFLKVLGGSGESEGLHIGSGENQEQCGGGVERAR